MGIIVGSVLGNLALVAFYLIMIIFVRSRGQRPIEPIIASFNQQPLQDLASGSAPLVPVRRESGHFTDNLPTSDPIPEPYAPALHRSQSHEPEPPVEGAPSKTTQQTDPQSLNPTAQNSINVPVRSNGDEQEGGADKSAVEQAQEQSIDQQEQEQEQEQAPRTPPRQTDTRENLAKMASDFPFDSMSEPGTLLSAQTQKIGYELDESKKRLAKLAELQARRANKRNANWESRYDAVRREKEQHLEAQRALDEDSILAAEADSLRCRIQELTDLPSTVERSSVNNRANARRQMELRPVPRSLSSGDISGGYVTKRFKLARD